MKEVFFLLGMIAPFVAIGVLVVWFVYLIAVVQYLYSMLCCILSRDGIVFPDINWRNTLGLLVCGTVTAAMALFMMYLDTAEPVLRHYTTAGALVSVIIIVIIPIGR